MFAKGELYVDELLDKEFNRIVGEVLKNKRERKGYSLQELSNKMTKKVSIQTYKQLQLYIEKKQYSVEYINKVLGLLRKLIKFSNKYHNTKDYMINYIENYKKVNERKKRNAVLYL